MKINSHPKHISHQKNQKFLVLLQSNALHSVVFSIFSTSQIYFKGIGKKDHIGKVMGGSFGYIFTS